MIPNMEEYLACEREPEFLYYCMRALWHDYHSPRIYMITLMKHPGIAPFCYIKGSVTNGKVSAKAQPMQLGHHIFRALFDWQRRFPVLKVQNSVRMPDHVHFLVHVKERTVQHLDDLIQDLVDDIDNRHKYILKRDFDFDFNGHVFLRGYTDSILSRKGQHDVLYDYIEDNPRRLYLRQQFPAYFKSVLVMAAGTEEFSAYGNLCLLEHHDKVVVRYSRRFTETERESNRHKWAETIRSRGVLISPFIHSEEKEYLHKAIAEGGRAIIITNNGFQPRWKPSKGFIDATAEGRLLFLGPKECLLKEPVCTREQSMLMNEQAKFLAKLPPDAFRLKSFKQSPSRHYNPTRRKQRP